MQKTKIILFCAAFTAIITSNNFPMSGRVATDVAAKQSQEMATAFGLAMTDKSALTGEEILKKVDEIRGPGDSFSFDVEVSYFKEKKQSRTQKFKVYVKEHTKSLVKFVAPAENKGRALLMVQDNMWIYIPATHEPLRISPLQRLLGQVANADIARIVYHLDYQVKMINKEEKTLKLSLRPKKGGLSYEKIEMYIDQETLEPQKAIFLSSSLKPLKTMYFLDYQEILGKRRPLQLKIIDEIRKGEESIVKYDNFKIGDWPDYFFRKDHLKHLR